MRGTGCDARPASYKANYNHSSEAVGSTWEGKRALPTP
jgi:hypothetical protein